MQDRGHVYSREAFDMKAIIAALDAIYKDKTLEDMFMEDGFELIEI